MGTLFRAVGKNMRQFTALMLAIVMVFGLVTISNSNASAQEQREVLAEWRPGSVPAGAESYAATGGLAVNSNAALTLSSGDSFGGVGTGAGTNPYAYTTTNWHDGGMWWQFSGISTAGYENIEIAFAVQSSNTGPMNFALEYSLDNGTTWLAVTAGGNPVTYTVANGYTPVGPHALPTAAADIASLTIRLLNTDSIAVNGGVVGSGGTSRVSNVVISGEGSDGSGGGGDDTMTIAEARALGSGAAVEIEGVVTRAIQSSATNLTSCTLYIQDDTAGIAVFRSGIRLDTYEIGAKVKVTGTLSLYQGVLQVGAGTVTIEVLEEPLAPRTPDLVTVAGLNSGAYEGKLVKLVGVRLTNIATNSNHEIEDSLTGARTVLRSSENTTLPGFAVGQFVDIVGIASNFNGTAQIQASRVADITEGKDPADTGGGTEPVLGEEELLALWDGVATASNVSAPFVAQDGYYAENSRLSASSGVYNTTGSNNTLWYSLGSGANARSWQFELKTTGMGAITFSYRTFGTAPAAGNWEVRYSLDNVTYHSFDPQIGYSSTGTDAPTSNAQNYTLPSVVNDLDVVYIRLVPSATSGNARLLMPITIKGNHIVDADQLQAPTVNPESGAVPLGQVLSFTPHEADADVEGFAVQVSADGGATWVVAQDNEFTLAALPVTVQVKATAPGMADSRVIEYSYTHAKLANVIPNVTPGATLREGSPLSLRSDVNDATIVYTINGGTELTYTTALVVSADMFDETTGRLTIRTRATKEGYIDSDWAEFRYTLERTGGEKVYFGQMHSHTTLSDGTGTVEEAYRYARDNAGLDFFAVTDHSNSFDHTSSNSWTAAQIITNGGLDTYNVTSTNWQRGINAAANAFREGEFISFYGYEMTWSGGPGHINTFATAGFASRNNTVLNAKPNDSGMRAYYDLLKAAPASISMFNHPGTTFGNFNNFAYYDAVIGQRITLLEVGNGEGAIGSGGYFPSYEQYDLALDKGWLVAPANSQDNHRGRWGDSNTARTAIWTNDLSLDGVYNALRLRRVYSTEVADLEIVYLVNGMPLGTIFDEIPDTATFTAEITNPTSGNFVKEVMLVTNGGVRILRDTPGTQNYNYSKTVDDPAAGWYYLRVIVGTPQGDRIAVTAPVWFGQGALVGFNDVSKSTNMAVTGEEFTITAEMFNGEPSSVTIESIEYTVNGTVLASYPNLNATIPASGSYTHQQAYTPMVERAEAITVSAVVRFADGQTMTISSELNYNVIDSERVTYIGIDGSHRNAYVDGNYRDTMGNFTALAANENVRAEVLTTPEALIAAANNPKYKMLIINAPDRHSSITSPRYYSQEVISAIENFSKRGGIVIIGGLASFSENSFANTQAGRDPMNNMAGQQNLLLAAIGSTLRISWDQVLDPPSDRGGSGTPWAMHLRDSLGSYHWTENSPLLDGVFTVQRYSQFSGSSIFAVNPENKGLWNAAPATTVPESVTRVVSTSQQGSSDDTHGALTRLGFTIPKYDGRYMIMAHETVTHADGTQALVVAAGGAFMSNFEVSATDIDNVTDQFSNFNICLNLIRMVAPREAEPDVIDIADARELALGTPVAVEGTVTSNVYAHGEENTGFFDSIYMQDETAGINLFPVAEGVVEGQAIRVIGRIGEFQGEKQITVERFEVIDPAINKIVPREVSTEEAMSPDTTGELIKTEGVVSDIFSEGGSIVQFTITDDTGVGARVFINAYITSGVDLSFVKDGAIVSVAGLASVGENETSSDFLSRIRVRDRNEIVLISTGIKVTSLRIAMANGTQAAPMIAVARNSNHQFGVIVNEGAPLDGIVWSVNNTSLATVDAKTGEVTIKGMAGNVTLTARDTDGVSHSIILRIA